MALTPELQQKINELAAITAATDIAEIRRLLAALTDEINKSKVDDVLQHFLTETSQLVRAIIWVKVSGADDATLNKPIKLLQDSLKLDAKLESAKLKTPFKPEDRLMTFTVATDRGKELNGSITRTQVPKCVGDSLSASKNTINEQWQEKGLTMKAVRFESDATAYQYSIEFDKATYVEKHDKTNKTSAVEIKLSVPMENPYDKMAEVTVLAKIALLKLLYDDYTPDAFANLLSGMKVVNSPRDTSQGRQLEKDKLYCAALDRAYDAYGFSVGVALDKKVAPVTAAPASGPAVRDPAIVGSAGASGTETFSSVIESMPPCVKTGSMCSFDATISHRDALSFDATISTVP